MPVKAEAAPNLPQISQVKIFLAILGEEPDKELKQRIRSSIEKVSQKALVGKDINQVQQNREYLELTIQQVFDRVLTGYQVKKVVIKPASITHVYVELLPTGQVVEKVSLSIIAKDVPSVFQDLIAKEQPQLEERANKALQGLPIDTMGWSQLALEPLLEKMIAKYLPGFKAGIEFTWGPETKLMVTLQPAGPVIRDVEVSVSSESFPKVFLQSLGKKTQEQAQIFKGLPLAFVEANLPEISQELQAEMKKNPLTERYGLALEPKVKLGETTKVSLGVESNKYFMDLKASLALGSSAPHQTEVKGCVGAYLKHRQELYVETSFYPNPIKLEWSGGWNYSLNDQYQLGYRYNFTEEETHLSLKYSLNRGTIKVDRNLKDKTNEFTYTYPLDNYLSYSLVSNSQGDTWMILTVDL